MTPIGPKVFAGWYGGYLGSDRWRVSSGIVSFETFEDRYEFVNYSGSRYVCYFAARGMSGLMQSVFGHYHELTLDHDYPEVV